MSEPRKQIMPRSVPGAGFVLLTIQLRRPLMTRDASNQCPHLTAHRKAPMKGLIGPGNGGFPCTVDGFGYPRPMLFCRRSSYECCQWSRKCSHSSKWGCTGIDHEIPCHTRSRVDEIVAIVCSFTEIRRFRLPPPVTKTLQRLTSIFVK